jgi:hypothetical protein
LTGCGVCMKFGIKSVTAIRFVFIILSYYNLSYNNLRSASAWTESTYYNLLARAQRREGNRHRMAVAGAAMAVCELCEV